MADFNLTETDAFRPLNPPLRNGPTNRSRENYLSILSQFDVVHNPRYKPNRLGKNETYCNIFVWDVTSAMECEIPHWLDLKKDDASEGVGKGIETNANFICKWLERKVREADEAKQHLPSFRWYECVANEAARRANDGFPAVVAWYNPGGIGHVAMVMPSKAWSVAIAQAGLKNYYDAPVMKGFGTHGPLKYFWHD